MLISLVLDGERTEITLWLTCIQYVNVLLMIVHYYVNKFVIYNFPLKCGAEVLHVHSIQTPTCLNTLLDNTLIILSTHCHTHKDIIIHSQSSTNVSSVMTKPSPNVDCPSFIKSQLTSLQYPAVTCTYMLIEQPHHLNP